MDDQADVAIGTGMDPNASAAAPMTLEEIEARRYADNLDRAKANGYVDASTPTIGERVAMLVAGVQHAMDNNAPMSREYFAEMKELLGVRNAEPVADETPKAE